MKIGVFDSGLGGLAVLKELIHVLPEYDFVYLGDNKNAPYGNKSAQEIFELSKKAIIKLFELDCDLVIIACNTVSAESLKRVQQELLPLYPGKKVLGVIRPTVEELVGLEFKNIGVIGTKATIESGAFGKEIEKILPEAKVYGVASLNLARLIEDGGSNYQDIFLEIESVLSEIKDKIEVLILGCTHYPLVKDIFFDYLPSEVRIIDPRLAVAVATKEYLKRHEDLDLSLSKKSKIDYFLTQSDVDYDFFCLELFGHVPDFLPIEL